LNQNSQQNFLVAIPSRRDNSKGSDSVLENETFDMKPTIG
jgi:hypothetical protein